MGRPWGIYFGFYKTRHILLSDSANCTVLRAVVLTQYRRVTDRQTDRRTDGQTDGIAVASTALALRALRRAVKTEMLRRNGPIVKFVESVLSLERSLRCERFVKEFHSRLEAGVKERGSYGL